MTEMPTCPTCGKTISHLRQLYKDTLSKTKSETEALDKCEDVANSILDPCCRIRLTSRVDVHTFRVATVAATRFQKPVIRYETLSKKAIPMVPRAPPTAYRA